MAGLRVRSGKGLARLVAVAGVLVAAVPGVIVLSVAPAGAAARVYSVPLKGAQEVPPNASTAGGSAQVSLNSAETAITVRASWFGLTTPATAGHIHGPGGPGVIAGIVFGFTGVPAATNGSIPPQTFAITAAQVAQLKAGQYYVNIHTSTFPNGEIRGQILPTQDFVLVLSGANEVPPNGSPAIGTALVSLNDAETSITVNANWTGLVAPANAGHIHGPGGPGVIAGVLFGFSGVPAVTTGAIPEQTFAITPAQVAQLKAGQYYVNIHTGTFPNGEIRGQIVDTTPPICSYTIVAGNPKRIDFTVQDTGTGLASVQAPTANNIVTPFIPAVPAGTATPVTFSAVKINQAMSSQVAIVATDGAGNAASCS